MRFVHHQATLVYYDGPQVFEARDLFGAHYIATMLAPKDGRDCFLVAGVEPERLRQFLCGTLDLRSLIRDRSESEWYLGTPCGGLDDPIELVAQPGEPPDDFLPDAGFFLPRLRTVVTLQGTLKKADVKGVWRLRTDHGEVSGKTVEDGPSFSGLQIDQNYRFVCLEEIEESLSTGREKRVYYVTEITPLR